MKRTAALHYPEGTTQVGTARAREDRTVGRSFAERELMRRTGQKPASEFDDIASGYDPFATAPKVPVAKKKPAKYRNEKCESGGIKFDSEREMKRWHELLQMQARGEISELELQVPFVLAEPVVIAGRKRPALRYVADFVYEKGGETVIEDVKGRVTEGYRIKRHLMAARGLRIVEIK
ncbi:MULTISPECIES: DUF1064 domain-containing protein [unclassified Caballeronia]|uniref:DUF1064 domain-containing protein n=1 Tax=unclassified Caballeronia TaxID=2646786 RepID=UPI002027DCD5|nr:MULTISPECIES: DUF1064 domain-containing protein [unclassified Caballeronia]